MHRTLSHLKEKLIPHRHWRANGPEKNRGFVMVDRDESGHVHISTEDIDQQDTRRGQSCVLQATHADSIDLDRIPFMPTSDGTLPTTGTSSSEHPLLGPTIGPVTHRTLGKIPLAHPHERHSSVFQIPMMPLILNRHARAWNVTCPAQR